LDESTEREELEGALRIMAASAAISLFVTSHHERDVEEMLVDIMNDSIAMKAVDVDEDIDAYVKECLRTDSILRKRPQSVKTHIEEVLTRKSGGM
jgi:hypothetical protein